MAPETQSTPDLQPLLCTRCGAPVPLGEGPSAICAHCGARVPIPATYQALRERAKGAREARQQAEGALRELLDGAFPPWVSRLFNALVLPAGMIGVPLVLASTQGRCPWSVRAWIVLGGLAPLVVLLFPALILSARSRPWAYLEVLGASLGWAARHDADLVLRCAHCGAPLTIEPEAFAATCDYCLADTWVFRVSGRHDPGRDREGHREDLATLVATRQFATFDLRLLTFIYVPLVVAVLSAAWLALPA